MRTWTAANSLQMRRMIKNFHSAGATDKESAKTVEQLNIRQNKVFRYLLEDGVIISEDNNRYWMDIAKAHEFLSRIRKKAIIVVTKIILLSAVIYAIYWLISKYI